MVTLSPLLQNFLKAFSAADLLQISLALLLWIALVLLALIPLLAPPSWWRACPAWNPRRVGRLFLPLLGVALVVWRLPELCYTGYYNIDESHFLAVAQRFAHDGVAWRSADGATAGPLDCYVLLWGVPLGLPFGYFLARFTGLICIFVTIAFLFKSVSLIVGRRKAPLISLAAGTFYLLAWQNDFVHYTSEHLPVALLSVSAWFVLVLWHRPKWLSALILGIFLGAVPFAKIQGAPIACYLFFVALATIFLSRASRSLTRRGRFSLAAVFIGGGLVVPVLILGPVLATGTWPDFVQRYLLLAIRYDPQMLFEQHASRLQIAWEFIKGTNFISSLLLFSILMLLLRLLSGRGFARTWLIGLAIVGGYVFVIGAVILKSPVAFPHYLLFLPGALVLLAAWSMRGLRGVRQPVVFARYSAALPLLYLSFCLLPQLMTFPIGFRLHPRLSVQPPPDPIVAVIKASTVPGDTLAIWGYSPEYFIWTGLPSATRDIVSFCALLPGKDSDYYREAFVADLKTAKPRVFIDTVGMGSHPYPVSWPHPVEKARYTMYPALAEYIDAHYHLQAKVVLAPGDTPVFVFVRNQQE